MKGLRAAFILVLTFALFDLCAQDTTEIKQGVIRIRKPVTTPFVKVEYNLYLADVHWVDELVYFHGYPEMNRVPVYDSSIYAPALQRVYPSKSLGLSRYFALNMLYNYPVSDTPRVDTLVIGMLLGKTGKIEYVDPDTENANRLSAELEAELASIAMSLEDQDWGRGGGYLTPGKLLKQGQFVSENYYCEMYVIVSSYPLTKEQQRTASLFPPYDVPLNSPPVDVQQEEFLKNNSFR